jgi:hypothetical protein
VTAATTILANVTGLSFTVSNGVCYEFGFNLLYVIGTNVTNTTCGLRLGLTFPAATVVGAEVDIGGLAEGTAGVHHGVVRASGGSVVAANVGGGGNTVHPAFVYGVILPSADGILSLQYGYEVTTTAGPIIKQGSMGWCNQIP